MHFQDPIYLKWLSSTPSITTIRINTLRTTAEKAVSYLQNAIKDSPDPIQIECMTDLPEVISIKQISVQEPTIYDFTLKEVIVDIACGAAVLRGAHIYAPGVIGMMTGVQIDEIVNVFADLAGTCKKGSKVHSSEQNRFIARGKVKMHRQQLFNSNDGPLNGIAIEILQNISNVPSLGNIYAAYSDGVLQNLPSIVCGRVVNPKPGDLVLDMCAAPGNKTTHLAELMEDRGRLIALDKSTNRVKLLQHNIDEWKLNVVKCYAFDASKAVTRENDGRKVADGPPFAEGSFDKILLDAPCSGMGNRPILASKMTLKEQTSYPILQKKLFAAAVSLLKPGGILVYSTCTIFASENEQIVRWALEKFGNRIELVPAEPIYGSSGLPGTGLTNAQR